MRYQGKLFRALNPLYARDPLSGHGAELHGGRFNPKGMPALYASLSVVTALRVSWAIVCSSTESVTWFGNSTPPSLACQSA